ncbi:MAG: AMP-dependent synthetase/ligase [Pyrinomonadaceae bacterium]
MPTLCLTALEKYNKRDAINRKQGGAWRHISAREYINRVRGVALGLWELGIRKGDRVALLSENRPEWSIVDLGILSLGAVNVPIYTTQSVEQVRYILEDSGAQILFVSNRKIFKHARAGIEGVEQLKYLISFDGDIGAEHGATSPVITLEELERRGAALDKVQTSTFDEAIRAVNADDLATIIYTSGTTGEPKGVMLTHDNFVTNVFAISSSLPIYPTDVSLSVLPLSHIFERTCYYVFCWDGVSVYYAASTEQIGDYLREVRPTIMTAVPRLFEKVYHRIVKKGTTAGGWKQKTFTWAMRIGVEHAELKDKGVPIPVALSAQHKLASRLVFSKWREGVGGRLRYFVSGGAPLSPTLSYAFWAADIPILQGYGMTETCVVSANRTDANKIGTVGQPFPGIEVKLDDEGEILVRGRNIMRGYYNKPDETRDMFTADGWFKTGDVGTLDDKGRLSITDRKKELFKLSNGKYIAPQLIESLIKQSAFVNQVVVVGAGRKQPAALIVPDWEALQSELHEDEIKDGKTVKTATDANESKQNLSRHPAIVKIVQREVLKLTSTLHDYERVRRVALLPEDFSIERGELTPTLKVKRRVIDEKYGDVIAELYGDAKEDKDD